jgi:demethylmenaquinone methyltransferase/2-methoxy-6-polyprenyl-1,4-benzoquinol methylase
MKKNKPIVRLKDYDLTDAREKKACNQAIFREVAPKYNRITRILSFNRDKAWKAMLARRLPVLRGAECLDLACGTGDISFLLARRYADGRVTALDLSAEMLGRARAANTFKNIRFVLADMCGNGLEAGAFDVITGGYALRNAPDLDRVLHRVYTLLKPGGSAFFLEFARSGHRYVSLAQLTLLRLWGGLWGRLLHGNPDIYGYIAGSLKVFPHKQRLRYLLTAHGFERIKIISLFLGMMSLIMCKK